MQNYQKLSRALLSASLAFALFLPFVMPPQAVAAQIQQETAASTAYHQGVLQHTTYGMVSGLRSEGILSWQGLPYAKPPVRELRWKAPQKPDAWSGVFSAVKTGNIGIQGTKDAIKGSEDCLNLNIFRPDSTVTNLPILFYIHGGNNQTGTSEELAPQKLAINTNSIVITLNYRLGLLGFNSLPALKTGNPLEDSGNYTLLDFSQALDWIKENAAFFGGNPQNITISGFSAGGRDVMAMLTSPIFKGKYQKAISFSGGMTMSDPQDSSKIIAKALSFLVVEDGIVPSEEEGYHWLLQDNADVRNYLYGLSADRLATTFGNARIRMSGFPHLYKDGTVLPKQGFDGTSYNEVPVIMLTGSNEFSAFTVSDPYFKLAPKNHTLLSDSQTHKELVFSIKYGSKFYGLFNAEESAVKMIENYHAPIYTCMIKWGNNKSIVGNEMAELVGATHGIFLPFLTDEPISPRSTYPQAFDNNGARELTKKFQSYIANFLWTGNPNGKGLTNWNAWKSAKKGPSQLIFDANKDNAEIFMSYDRTSYDEILQEIEADQTLLPEEKTILIKNILNGRWFSKQFDQHFHNESLWIK
ncbi:carboxylesterase family protein [Propionispira raffinosivorans]|uniref:carboxylesterase family protein n=1 Tax=Propionispira raffinosivorans TaxID=86959 RepID=UPI00035F1B5D|nr:carboxylesterase family protein [Propionispira raffinosivorans]